MKLPYTVRFLFFAWYDFWIGFYWDREKRILYIAPIPMFLIALYFEKRR